MSKSMLISILFLYISCVHLNTTTPSHVPLRLPEFTTEEFKDGYNIYTSETDAYYFVRLVLKPDCMPFIVDWQINYAIDKNTFELIYVE